MKAKVAKGSRNSSKGQVKVPWGKVRWGEQDIVIADRFGCSRERVRQKRKELGVGKSKKWHCRRGSAREKIDALKDTARMTLKEIAKVAGCSTSYALQCLKRAKKAYNKLPLGGKAKYNWAAADWSKGYREIANDLGIDNPGVVSQYRQRHGIAARDRTAAGKIRKAMEGLEGGEVLTPEKAAVIGGCGLRHAKEVLKEERVGEPVLSR